MSKAFLTGCRQRGAVRASCALLPDSLALQALLAALARHGLAEPLLWSGSADTFSYGVPCLIVHLYDSIPAAVPALLSRSGSFPFDSVASITVYCSGFWLWFSAAKTCSPARAWAMGSLETSLGLLFCRPLSTHQALTAAGRVLFPSLLRGHYTSLADLKVSAWLVGQASQLQGPAKQAF